MKIQTIDSQAWWIALADEIRPAEGLDGPVFFSEVARIFEFSEVPKAAAQGGGFEFNRGCFRRDGKVTPISQIALYNDGININVQGPTSGAEEILQMVIELGISLGIREPITRPLHYFISTIVVDFEKSLDALFPKSLLEKVSEAGIWENSHFLSIAFSPDKSERKGPLTGVNPPSFSIGRRVDVPYGMNRYFSQASTTTEKHIGLLEHLEGLV
jgi:hypothetical protein